MAHRGPDDSGLASAGEISLGMQRLAVFDPANGHQPLLSPDGRFTLLFNGAIYNFRELRTELANGWDFRSDCDTEVLLAAFARWGAECVRRLRGMFAFAVWDATDRSLCLARDPFGIKPLYWHHAGGRFAFASEVRALLASGYCEPTLDPAAVSEYLGWLSVPAPRTIYRDIESVRPGELLTLRRGVVQRHQFWSFSAIPPAPACHSREEFLEQLRQRLENSVRAHQLADVPVGAFLSGGLDSASVVGLMVATGATPLRTFSIGFDESGYSEEAGAAATARHFGTRHESTILRGGDVAADLPALLAAFDQPTGDGINTYYASRAARAGGVTVALSGLGGDELFGGYPSFRDIPRLARWLPAWQRLPTGWRDFATRRLAAGNTRQRKLADFLRHARTPDELGALQRRVFPDADCRALLHADAQGPRESAAPFHPELERLSRELGGAAEFDTISAWEIRTYMADVLLRDSDVMSMRHSLELRVPLIDRPLVEWLWRQPASFKADGRRTKSALADALADLLPPAVLVGRKQGFTLPMRIWMKRELRPFLEETFSRASVARSGLFAVPAVQQLWADFMAGNDARQWSRVWSLAVLVNFANRPAPSRANRETASPPPALRTASIAPAVRAFGERESPRPASPFPGRTSSARAARARTLFLTPEIFASEGGIPRILQAYLRALCELAEPHGTVRLLALNDADFAAPDLRRHANERLAESVACRRRKMHFVRSALRMSRACDQIVCGHVFLLPVAWLARRLNPRLRYYLIAHGIEVWRPFTVQERWALRGAERIFCVSEHTQRELERHYPRAAARTTILHNALDPFFAVEPGRPLAACPPVILSVTRLTYADRYKGVQHLIEAMPEVRRAVPGARLRVIGRGDDVPRLAALRDSLGLREAVEFAGFLNDEQLAGEMKSCRLFALPSRKEGFGLVFLEAMAKGRPCIGARAGGIPEVITPETGRLVDYGDVPGLSRACAESLRTAWDEQAILRRAQSFAFPAFRARLGDLLAA